MKVPEPRKLKSGSWFIQLRLGGESIPITAVSKADCKHQAEKVKANYRAGENITATKTSVKLGDAIDAYIASKSNVLSPSTVAGYKAIRNKRFADYMGKPMKSIKDWQSIVNEEAAIVSPRTVDHAFRLVSTVYASNGLTKPSVKLPKKAQYERAWLTPEQIQTFVTAVQGQKGEICGLLALHSLRRSEILALTWGDIDFDIGTIKVSGAAVKDENSKLVQKGTNKNAASTRVVPIMIPELTTALKAAKAKSKNTYIINVKSPDTVGDNINSICRQAGLPEVGTHGLRHSFASLAYHLGMSELETMAIGGWSDFATMRRIYTHLSGADKHNAQNKMMQFYNNANKTLTESSKATQQ